MDFSGVRNLRLDCEIRALQQTDQSSFKELGSDDARGFRLEFLLGKLAAQKLQINTGARTPIRPIAYEASQKNESIKYFGLFKRRETESLSFFFRVVLDECGQRAVKPRGGLRGGRPFVIDAGDESAIGFAQRCDTRERLLIGQITMIRRKLRNGESQAGNEGFTVVDHPGRKLDAGERSLACRKRFAMFLLVAMRSDQVRAPGRAIEGDFAFPAATRRADLLALRRAKSLRPSFGANRACRALCHF